MTRPDRSRSPSDEEARHELYALLHGSYTRRQALERVVEIGSVYLDVDHGHVTDIDVDGDRWDVIASTDPPDGPYPAGLTAKLSDSYCRRTMEKATPLALHDAGAQGWADDHAYQLHHLDTYLGIRIEVFDEPYGTICFVEPEARAEPFSPAELLFVELAGQVLRKVLEDTHHEKDLANRDRLISVLNRVLRHNLRNGLNVVQGNATLLEERTAGDEARLASIIHSCAAELLSLAEKSRVLEQLTRTVPVARPMDVVPVVDGAVAEVRAAHPSVDVTYSAPEEAMSVAAPQLSEAVRELLENAVKHAGEDPTVAAAVRRESHRTTVQIEDDGPGLPGHERRILAGESETALEHGSGLGLALVHWVVTNIDGDIDVTVAPTGTTVEVHLQPLSSVAAE